MGQCKQLCSRSNKRLESREINFTCLGDWNYFEYRASVLTYMLPWNNVGMMFKGRDQNFIARLQARAQKTLGYQGDSLGSSTCEYHFLAGTGIDKATYFFTRTFKLVSGSLAERMNTPVNVGVILLVILTDGIDDNLRMLA